MCRQLFICLFFSSFVYLFNHLRVFFVDLLFICFYLWSFRKKIFSRKTRVPVYYWDMTILADYWKCFGDTTHYHHTISATLVYGLREALAILAEEGLEASWARHSAARDRLHRGLAARGFEFFVKNPEHRLTTVTAIKMPLGTSGPIISRRAMEK